jgi:hypothetical protein
MVGQRVIRTIDQKVAEKSMRRETNCVLSCFAFFSGRKVTPQAADFMSGFKQRPNDLTKFTTPSSVDFKLLTKS